MIIDLDKLGLKEEIRRIQMLHWGHFLLTLLSLLIEFIHFSFEWSFLFKALFLLIIYKISFKTVKELYYTFWTISTVLALYFCWKVIGTSLPSLFYINFLALTFLLIEMYTLYSPIYYPQVSWWEYDFRYKNDLKVFTELSEGNRIEGRLSDLRRGAGCLSFFNNFDIGEIVLIESNCNEEKVFLKAEVVSKRQYYLGRPKNYGVKFHFNSSEEKKSFELITNFWKSQKIKKNSSLASQSIY